MAIVKVKPTSPGRRAMVKVVNKNLGKPFAALLDSQTTAGRNNNGRITTRHKGGGHSSTTVSSISVARRMAFRQRSSVSSTTRTVARTSRWCSTQTANVATSSPRRA